MAAGSYVYTVNTFIVEVPIPGEEFTIFTNNLCHCICCCEAVMYMSSVGHVLSAYSYLICMFVFNYNFSSCEFAE